MPQDLVIHDYADFKTKVLAEGIPRPTLNWTKDGKQVNLSEEGVQASFANVSENQASSDFSIEHFGEKFAGNVSMVIWEFLRFRGAPPLSNALTKMSLNLLLTFPHTTFYSTTLEGWRKGDLRLFPM